MSKNVALINILVVNKKERKPLLYLQEHANFNIGLFKYVLGGLSTSLLLNGASLLA